MGDEGGFAPDLAGEEEAIEYILECGEKAAGYEPGKGLYAGHGCCCQLSGRARQEGRIPAAEGWAVLTPPKS